MWIIFVIAIILLIILILIKIYNKYFIGLSNELLLKKLNPEEYKIISNLFIKARNKKTYQIDYVIISLYGIFVITIKQYNGYLEGNDQDKNWSIKMGKNKYYIHNPVQQNNDYLKVLSETLKLPLKDFISIIAISSNHKINIISDIAIPIKHLLPKIKSYLTIKNININETYTKLYTINLKNKIEKKQHITEIKKNMAKYNQDSFTKCPLCGSKLVKRKSKYGSFIGCSNYPKCLYTRKN